MVIINYGCMSESIWQFFAGNVVTGISATRRSPSIRSDCSSTWVRLLGVAIASRRRSHVSTWTAELHIPAPRLHLEPADCAPCPTFRAARLQPGRSSCHPTRPSSLPANPRARPGQCRHLSAQEDIASRRWDADDHVGPRPQRQPPAGARRGSSFG